VAKHASAARCARSKLRKRTVARRRQLHLLMLLPQRAAPRRRGQLPNASPRPQFGAPWMLLGGSPPQSTHPHGVDLWLQTSKRARRHLPRQHAGSVAALVRGTAVKWHPGGIVSGSAPRRATTSALAGTSSSLVSCIDWSGAALFVCCSSSTLSHAASGHGSIPAVASIALRGRLRLRYWHWQSAVSSHREPRCDCPAEHRGGSEIEH
jgi:hypothetical protein